MPTRDAAPRPSRKPSEKSNAPGGKSNARPRVEIERPAGDDGGRRQQRANPEADRERPDRFDAAIEQDDVEEADASRDEEDVDRRQIRPDVARIAGEADVARGNLERPAEDELPDEEERDQSAEALAAIGLAEVHVTAAGARHRRAELAPDQAVGDRDEHRHEPAEQRLRPPQPGHEERNRDEGTDPNHVRHVERGRLQQAEAPGEGRRSSFGRMRRRKYRTTAIRPCRRRVDLHPQIAEAVAIMRSHAPRAGLRAPAIRRRLAGADLARTRPGHAPSPEDSGLHRRRRTDAGAGDRRKRRHLQRRQRRPAQTAALPGSRRARASPGTACRVLAKCR